MQPIYTTINVKEVVISLIEQDIISNKLVLGLTDLGLEAGKYHLDIAHVVFHLVGFPDPDDKLMEAYFNFMERASTIKDVEEERDQVKALAGELFDQLLSVKNGSQE